MNKKEKICAVVLTYNRKKLLLECLEALKNQTRPLDGIFLIDNASTDGTPELLLEKGYIKELPPENLKESWEKTFEIKLPNGNKILLHYVRMHENIGTGGFHEGLKRGYEKGYDWLWLMDDDAEPYTDALEKIDFNDTHNNILAIACNVIHPTAGIQPATKGFIKNGKIRYLNKEQVKKDILIDFAGYAGLFISKEAIEKVGLPYKEFFMWYYDIEYCLRIRQVGNILSKSNSFIIHKDASAQYERKKLLIFTYKKYPINLYWKILAGIRNKAFVFQKYLGWSDFKRTLYFLYKFVQIYSI